jgi:hypothetical protein
VRRLSPLSIYGIALKAKSTPTVMIASMIAICIVKRLFGPIIFTPHRFSILIVRPRPIEIEVVAVVAITQIREFRKVTGLARIAITGLNGQRCSKQA